MSLYYIVTEKERNIPTRNPQGLNDNGVNKIVGRNRSVFMVDLRDCFIFNKIKVSGEAIPFSSDSFCFVTTIIMGCLYLTPARTLSISRLKSRGLKLPFLI